MAKEDVDMTKGQQGQSATSLPQNAPAQSQVVPNEQADTPAATDSHPVDPVTATVEDAGHQTASTDIASSASTALPSVAATPTGGTDSNPAPVTNDVMGFGSPRPWLQRRTNFEQNGCLTPSILYGQTGMSTYQGLEMIQDPFQTLQGYGPGQDTAGKAGKAGMNGDSHHEKGVKGTNDSSSSTGATGHRTT